MIAMQTTFLAAADIQTSKLSEASNPALLHIICERDVGLFSLIQQVIANVAYAVHERRVPIAFFGRRCSYWTPNGYRGRDTVWEYYFEPIIPEYSVRAIPEHIRKCIEERPPVGDFGYLTGDGTFVTSNFGEHRGYRGKSLVIPHAFDDPSDDLRRTASTLINRYVRVRQEVRERALKFHERNMQRRTCIGVHMRGTDAFLQANRVRWGPYLNTERYRHCIDDLLRRCPDAGIFVASDGESSLREMRDIYGDRVVATEAVRHQGGPLAGKGPTGEIMPAHLTVDADVAAKSGEEAIIDYLLLCRCNALVHNGSSLARTVLLTVPEMAASNTILPSRFGRKAFYFIRGVKHVRGRTLRWAARMLERWQHRAAVVRVTVSGRPLTIWHRLLWQRWLERRANRKLGNH
jgi:hypothetical protein